MDVAWHGWGGDTWWQSGHSDSWRTRDGQRWATSAWSGRERDPTGTDVEWRQGWSSTRDGGPGDVAASSSSDRHTGWTSWASSGGRPQREREPGQPGREPAPRHPVPPGRPGQQPGFWRAGRWVPRLRTASEERAHRGGQGPIRSARRQGRVDAWRDGTFRPAAFRRGVPPLDSPAMVEMRARIAAVLAAGAPTGEITSRQWTLQQWEDWETWNNPALLVDWSGPGLPGWQFVPEDESDEGVFMQLTSEEEGTLHELGVPDEVRRGIRDMLRTMTNHQNEDVGAEYRWGLRCWLLAWRAGCDQVQQVVNIIQQRVQGPVAYFPVVRDPRGRAQRERCVAFNRQWTAVATQLLDALVDREMVNGCASASNTAEVAMGSGEASRGVRERSRSRDSGVGVGLFLVVVLLPDSVLRGRDVWFGCARALPEDGASSSSVAAGESRVGTDGDTDVSDLVQRLQPHEAQRLERAGVRRQNHNGVGTFPWKIFAVVNEGGTRRDLRPETVQWCLHTTDRAVQMAIEMQDAILWVLTRRLQRGGDALALPDEDQRGESAQIVHELVVGLARAYLLALHNGVSDSWLDPETLPDFLRGRGSTSEASPEEGGDAGAGAVANVVDVGVRDVDPPADAVLDGREGRATDRSRSPTGRGRDAAASSAGPAPVHSGSDSLEPVAASVESATSVMDGDVVQFMQRLTTPEVVLLEDRLVGDRCIGELRCLLERLTALREASPGQDVTGWQVGAMVRALRTTTDALRGLCDVLEPRWVDAERAPTLEQRQEMVYLSSEFMQITAQMVHDLLHLGVVSELQYPALCDGPAALCDGPVALWGCDSGLAGRADAVRGHPVELPGEASCRVRSRSPRLGQLGVGLLDVGVGMDVESSVTGMSSWTWTLAVATCFCVSLS